MGSRLPGIETRAAIERVLLHEWDPIGIADCGPPDEYSLYAAALMGMLVRGADASLLEDALLRFERDAMGLEGNVARARRIADWLTLLTRWEPS